MRRRGGDGDRDRDGAESEGRAGRFGGLEDRLGHSFHRPDLLAQALTHASRPAEAQQGTYERLEFLGDRVLGLTIAALLFERFPAASEGELAHRFNQLVRRETCAEVALAFGLDREIRVGAVEAEAGLARKPALLADVCEAVLAAVFLDGGFDAARRVILAGWGDRLQAGDRIERDPKTTLQEWLQGRGHALPVYEEVGRTGPDHAPRFRIRVSGETFPSREGEATSKRAAEQAAARAVLEALGVWERTDAPEDEDTT